MHLFFFLLAACALFSETVATFYGPLEVEEAVLLELIHSAPFQRLKFIHQYGVGYYTKTHPEEYTRFDHSLGVFAILRANGASLEEQIAGLLHDVSHTVFSHVGDWVFAKENQEDDYQNEIHSRYLADSGIEAILNRHEVAVEDISPKRDCFCMLEQPLPDLCADRIDYNIQGAYFQKFLTLEETKRLFNGLAFKEGRWVLPDRDLAFKLARFSLFMTEDCWGSPTNALTSRWLADAIIHACKIGILSWHEFHFGIDGGVWDRLGSSQDPVIRELMGKLADPARFFRLVPRSDANLIIPFKCRGIDPWVKEGGGVARLSAIDPEFETEFQKTRRLSLEGWSIAE